jgi:hypothetical protein
MWMLVGVAAVLAGVLGIPALRALMGLALPDPSAAATLGMMLLLLSAWLVLLRLGIQGSRRQRAVSPVA